MNKKLGKTLKQIAFLSIGVSLIWFSFANSGLTLNEFLEGAKSMNYWYFIVSALFAMGSHYSRALRWKLLIKSTNHNPKTKNVFASVLFMYASNIAVPRSGEVARCGTIYKYEDIPIPTLLGTVFVERAIDLLTLLFFTGLLVIIQFDLFSNLYYNSTLPNVVESFLNNKMNIALVFLLLIMGMAAIYLLRKKIFSFAPMKKVEQLLIDLKNSLVQVFKMKAKLLFLFHTILIWIGYVGMFYICFFAFEPTSHLGLAAGLTAFIAGSFGMVAPTAGGAGTWHIMVIMALTALNISEEHAAIWTNVAFAVMTLTMIISGIIAFISLPFMNKNEKVS